MFQTSSSFFNHPTKIQLFFQIWYTVKGSNTIDFNWNVELCSQSKDIFHKISGASCHIVYIIFCTLPLIFFLFYHEWAFNLDIMVEIFNNQCFKEIFSVTTSPGHLYEYQWMFSHTKDLRKNASGSICPLIAIKQVPPSATLMSLRDLFPICFIAQ